MKNIINRKSTIIAAGLFISLCSSIALASETAEEVPSIWEGDIATSIFTLLLFAAMIFVLGKFAWGPILSGLQGREEYIGQQIKDAENLKAEADKSLRRYEARLAKAEERANEIMEQAREDAQKISKKITEEARAQAQDIVNQSYAALQSAKAQAVRELHQYSADLAVDLASKILGKSINAEEHRELIDNAISQLQQEG